MPEEPTASNESSPADDQAQWTDESGFEALTPSSDDRPVEDAPPEEASTLEATASDDWDATDSIWEDEMVSPPEEESDSVTTRAALAWLKPVLQRSRIAWRQVLAGLRNRIPAAAELSDTVLSIILIGILGLLLVLFNRVRQPSIAQSPATPEPPTETVAPPSEPAVPSAEVSPAAQPAAPPAAPTTDPADIVDLERIADIQAQLTNSSIYNAGRVIDSVQADFTRNRLTLVCNEDWYRLSEYDQSLLANQLLEQAAELAFADIELQTPNGQLIARNPVVGDEMVILLRERPPIVEPPERPRFRITIDR